MSTIFLAHSADDSHIIQALAERLELEGVSCWYFERDSRAGEPYLLVQAEAITSADYILVLVSEASVRSHEVTKEIEFSHRMRKKFLPVFLGINPGTRSYPNSVWTMAFGTSGGVAIDPSNLQPCVDAIARSLREDGRALQPLTRVATEKTAQIDNANKPEIHWVTDGIQVDIELLQDFTFTNESINRFLRGTQQYFLSGNKGLGKTLLMRYKRALLMGDTALGRSTPGHRGLLCIPEDRPFLDQMESLPTLSGEHCDLLARIEVCSSLWAFAIRTSVLSNAPNSGHRTEFPKRCASRHLPNWLAGERVAPTLVFKELIALTPKQFLGILDDFETALDYDFRHIHSGMAIFVDKLDHALRKVPRDVWVNIQAGFVDAAWECMNANNHIKVFGTIREEAYANYQSDIKPNHHGAVATMLYSLDDLQHLMDKLSHFYENKRDFGEFVGRRRLTNAQHDIVEDSFCYVYRHTTGRPRDMVIVCSELSRRLGPSSEAAFRQIVNEVSSKSVVAAVFEEMRVFLDCLDTEQNRDRFFRLLPYNILTRQELLGICRRFNGDESDEEWSEEAFTEILSAASDLWCCGLLGIVQHDSVLGNQVQRFKQPSDVFSYDPAELPPSPYYLIHPSLQNIIHKLRTGDGYRVFRYVVIGHSYPWQKFSASLIEFQRVYFRVTNPIVKEQVDRVLPAIHAALHAGIPLRIAEEGKLLAEIESLRTVLERFGLDDLALRLIDLVDVWGEGGGSVGPVPLVGPAR